MNKNPLSDQQRQRIQTNQQQYVESAQEPTLDLSQTQQGLLISHYGATVEVEDQHGDVHRCVLRQNLAPLVVGDRVAWQMNKNGNGVVLAHMARQSVLSRPNRQGDLKPVAANVDLMSIVIAAHPVFSENLLDQYLVAAELLNIEPLIVLNKKDLLKDAELKTIKKRLSVYKDIGVDVVLLSSHQKSSLEPLNKQLKGKTAVFVGQSGVGKSSLVQALLPASKLKVSAVSQQGHGRHTTTVARLYHLPGGGSVIDSPGVREFGLWHISEEDLFAGFREFQAYKDQCQFRNCQHNRELGCALHAAVKSGEITQQRFNSFKKLLVSINHVY